MSTREEVSAVVHEHQAFVWRTLRWLGVRERDTGVSTCCSATRRGDGSLPSVCIQDRVSGDVHRGVRRVAHPISSTAMPMNAFPPRSAVRPGAHAHRDLVHLLRTEILELRAENARLVQEQQNGLVDALTGVCSRRYFDRRLRQELRRADRFSQPLSLVIIDIADLRTINERGGAAQGDVVLRWVADLITKGCRDCDVPCRLGGDEFALILPQTRLAGAEVFVERLTRMLRTASDAPRLPGGMLVSLSFGLGSYPDQAETLLELVFEAEESMLEAKQAGPKSDRCVVAA